MGIIKQPEVNMENKKEINNQEINKNDLSITPQNRKARRAAAKKMGKKGRQKFNNASATIGEIAKQLNYIDLIDKLKQLNQKNEDDKNIKGDINYENTSKKD